MNNKSLFIYIIFGLANLFSTKVPSIGIVITLIEYIIVLLCVSRKEYIKSLVYYIVFTSLTLEMNAYIYMDGEAPFDRYHFLSVPFVGEYLYALLSLIIFYSFWKTRKSGLNGNYDGYHFVKWLWLLGITGFISVGICMLFNDNGMMNTGWYPKLSVSLFFKYVSFIFLCVSIIFAAIKVETREYLEKETIKILIAVAFTGIISVLLGYHGYYGAEASIMLVPLSVAFVPCLLNLYSILPETKKMCIFISFVLIILVINHPLVIGSKWYMVLAFSLIYFIYQKSPVRSKFELFSLFILFVAFIPIISDFLLSSVLTSDYNVWKLKQSMGMLDFFSYNSALDWFMSLDDSAKFRIDEPINIFMEYMEKPFYFLFGKGFGGTVNHHTIFCNWDMASSFTEEQRNEQLFYSMHESVGVLFLRHGLLGIVFFIVTISRLFKKWDNSPWVIMGIIWLVFYWSFGISFRIGVVALILALTSKRNEIDHYVEN